MFHNKSLSHHSGAMSPGKTIGRYLVGLPLVLSAALLIVAIADQRSSQMLESYSTTMYRAHGVAVEPGAIYGLVYTVAIPLTLLWLLAGLMAWSGRRRAFAVMVIALLANSALALAMLFATEYSQPVLPPFWGILAALPVVAGIAAAIVTRRRGRAAARSWTRAAGVNGEHS